MMLAALSDYFTWWQVPLLLIVLPVMVFGGGALLYVGGRFLAKSPKATYWRSVGTYLLAGVAAFAAQMAVGLLALAGSGAAVAAPFLGLGVGLLVTWLVIGAMFRVSFGQAILAWLPTLAASVLVIIPLLVSILMPGLARARELARRSVCMSNLREIGMVAVQYRSDHEDQWPADLDVLRSYMAELNPQRTGWRGREPPAGLLQMPLDRQERPRRERLLLLPPRQREQRGHGHRVRLRRQPRPAVPGRAAGFLAGAEVHGRGVPGTAPQAVERALRRRLARGRTRPAAAGALSGLAILDSAFG